MRLAFGLPAQGSLPPYSEFADRLDPAPHAWPARTVQSCLAFIGGALDFVRLPKLPATGRKITLARPTPLGCWLLAGAILSFLPAYRRTLGVWTLVAGGYLFGVFLVSQANPRYFAPAWPVIVPLLAVPADVLACLVLHFWKKPAARNPGPA